MATAVPEAAGDEVADVPRSLLRRLLADPAAVPEELAEFAVRVKGPKAEAAVERLRGREPDAGAEQLRQHLTARGVRACVSEGAFVGGPFLLLIPLAFCAAALEQAQLMLGLAALAGRDPRAPERVAELLVLQGAHPDEEAASAALAARGRGQARGRHPRGRAAGAWQVSWRLASLLGLVGPAAEKPTSSWLRRTGRWMLLAAVLLVGFVAPLVWLPYMAHSYRTATRAVARRASAYYFDTGDLVAADDAETADVGMVAAAVRAVLSVLVAVGVVVLVLVTDLKLLGGTWPLLALGLFGSSLATGVWWWLRRRAR